MNSCRCGHWTESAFRLPDLKKRSLHPLTASGQVRAPDAYDRDLYSLSTFHECGLISAGILVTRIASLNPVFDVLPSLKKMTQL